MVDFSGTGLDLTTGEDGLFVVSGRILGCDGGLTLGLETLGEEGRTLDGLELDAAGRELDVAGLELEDAGRDDDLLWPKVESPRKPRIRPTISRHLQTGQFFIIRPFSNDASIIWMKDCRKLVQVCKPN